jgi:enoyl-[acyl-carrier-protein] reductase (NADH)
VIRPVLTAKGAVGVANDQSIAYGRQGAATVGADLAVTWLNDARRMVEPLARGNSAPASPRRWTSCRDSRGGIQYDKAMGKLDILYPRSLR